jgi:hypothetical protein
MGRSSDRACRTSPGGSRSTGSRPGRSPGSGPGRGTHSRRSTSRSGRSAGSGIGGDRRMRRRAEPVAQVAEAARHAPPEAVRAAGCPGIQQGGRTRRARRNGRRSALFGDTARRCSAGAPFAASIVMLGPVLLRHADRTTWALAVDRELVPQVDAQPRPATSGSPSRRALSPASSALTTRSIVRGPPAGRAVRGFPRGGAPDSPVSERVRALPQPRAVIAHA